MSAQSKFGPINDRFLDGERRMAGVISKVGGVSTESAHKIIQIWFAHKSAKRDKGTGQISPVHGALLDRENILEVFRHSIEESETCTYCLKYGVNNERR